MKIQRHYYQMTGRVQNVGFRWTARHLAESLGLSGWVRNRRDGSVEMEVQGSLKAVNQMIRSLLEDQVIIRIDTYQSQVLPPVEGEKGFSVRF